MVKAVEFERHPRVRQAGVFDEPGNLVDAAHVVAMFGEVGGPVPRAAASIQDRPVDLARPGSDQRPIGRVKRIY